MGDLLGAKEHPEHYLLIYSQYFNDIWPQASSRVPNEDVLSPSKFSLDWVTYGVELVCKPKPWDIISVHRILMRSVTRSSPVPNEGRLSPSKSAPDWVTYSVKLGCTRAPGTLSLFILRILMTFGHTLHLGCRTKVY